MCCARWSTTRRTARPLTQWWTTTARCRRSAGALCSAASRKWRGRGGRATRRLPPLSVSALSPQFPPPHSWRSERLCPSSSWALRSSRSGSMLESEGQSNIRDTITIRSAEALDIIFSYFVLYDCSGHVAQQFTSLAAARHSIQIQNNPCTSISVYTQCSRHVF